MHDSVAFAKSHGTPQPPQLASVRRLVSQPLFALLSQLAKPAVHEGEQVPAAQVVVPLPFEHAVPQVPQLDVVLSGASQPLPGSKSQSPKLALHDVSTHVPA